jgi:hypothetical protein
MVPGALMPYGGPYAGSPYGALRVAAPQIPVGTVIEICQVGTGAVYVGGAGGVTVRNVTACSPTTQYSVIRLRKRAVNDWVASVVPKLIGIET